MMPSPARTFRLVLLAAAGWALLTGAAGVQSKDAFNRNVRVHNQTGWAMTQLQVSSGGGWSPGLLGPAGLAPGASTVVRMDDGVSGCRYALRAQFENGQSLQRDGVNACQIADYYFTR